MGQVYRARDRRQEGRGRDPRRRGRAVQPGEAVGSQEEAGRGGAALSTMFTFSTDWKMRADNPCKRVKCPRGEHRNRYLTDAEKKRLLEAVSHLDDREAAAAILLLLLTGARMNELLQATWEQFDLDDDGIWTKPASNTKQKRIHRIPLNTRAVAMLKQLRRLAEPGEQLVFPTRARVGNVRMAWVRSGVRLASPMSAFTICGTAMPRC